MIIKPIILFLTFGLTGMVEFVCQPDIVEETTRFCQTITEIQQLAAALLVGFVH